MSDAFFGAMLCELIEIDSVGCVESDPEGGRVLLAGLTDTDACRRRGRPERPLVGSDDRGRPHEPDIAEFRTVISAVEELDPGLRQPSRLAAHSRNRDDLPGPNMRLIVELLACHAPSKTAQAVSDLINQK